MSSTGKHWTRSEDANRKTSETRKAKFAAGELKPSITLKHGLSRHPSYNSWKKMMRRCNVPEDKDYPNYGGRGIQVCPRWHDVTNFVEDMGSMPAGFSLERVNVDGNYEPGNCCWLPHKFQGRNRRPWKHTPQGLENIRAARRNSRKQQEQ